jgi:hypothetical protein
MPPDPFENLSRDASNHIGVSNIGMAQSPADHSSNVVGRFNENHLEPLSARGDCCGDATRRTAIDRQVKLPGLGGTRHALPKGDHVQQQPEKKGPAHDA